MTRPWMALDVESSGELREYALQPWRVRQRKAWLTTVAFTVRHPTTGALISKGKVEPGPRDLRGILEHAIATGTRIVTWNGAFDIAWLIAYGCGDLVDKVLWLDGMLLWKHLDIVPTFAQQTHSYALKGIDGAVGAFCPDYLGYEEDVDYHDPSPEARAKLLHYNKLDNETALISAEAIWLMLDQKRRGVALIEAASLPLVARANFEGMRVNRSAVKRLFIKLTKQATELAAELEPQGVTEKVIRSPKQLSKLLFETWGLAPVKKTAAGAQSTDKDVLSQLSVVDERADKLRKFREALNLNGKFMGGLVKSCEYNGDMQTRPQARILGTYTSRMTYSGSLGKKGTKAERPIGFALHQMKNDKEFRSTILAPEDHDIVEFDAAGQEFRWMAIQANDQVMLNLCQPGEDPHSFMGASITPGLTYDLLRGWHKADDPKAKVPRKSGKVANLSLQFRTFPKTFQIRARTDYDLHLTDFEANSIWKKYQQTYRGVPIYWKSQIQKGKVLGYAETMAGRRVRVSGDWSGEYSWGMESTMINFPIQGTGGDQKYLALKIIKDVLTRYNARFAWDMHDGVYFYVPKTLSEKFAVEVRALLDNLPYRKAWDFDPPIPLTWDAKRGPSWGELTPVE